MKFAFLPLTVIAGAIAPLTVYADSGFYISGDLGINFARGFDTIGSSNDRASVCDEYINPMFDTVENQPGFGDENCTGPNRGATGDWRNDFDSAAGVLAGGAVGYSFSSIYSDQLRRGLRIELEYFYRESEYNEESYVLSGAAESGDKLMEEIVKATDRVDSITSHNIFVNLFYDFTGGSSFTPYVGIGGGVGFTDMDYSSIWARNHDPDAISTGEGLSNATQIRNNLKGTASIAQNEQSDTLYGFQLLLGVDYAMTDTMTIGLKGRWVDFGSFQDDNTVWDPLRGHPPNLRLDGSEPVSGDIRADDIEFFAVSVNLKYRF